jgi:2-polyprenyl-6-methoxyphenol hydroxylase-like FAD-dependent oxidoreductase
MSVLISGAGIAGPCLAYWLQRHGFSATIVERAPELRAGGYIIDFWGAGFDVADRMGAEVVRVPAVGDDVKESQDAAPGDWTRDSVLALES